MPTVALIHFTGKDTPDERWYAARLLAFTKATRLRLTPDAWQSFAAKSELELQRELAYMSSTIASSWEFIDLIFAINNVSRAAAQQITRTRNASYAMQSMRVTDVREMTAHVPPSLPAELRTHYTLALSAGFSSYQYLVDHGASLEDARGVLPLNTHCNLLAKYNLRAWVDLVRARESLRVQDEYREVIAAMKQCVTEVWPWASTFIEPKQAKAISIIEQVAINLPKEFQTLLAKAADLLKKEAA